MTGTRVNYRTKYKNPNTEVLFVKVSPKLRKWLEKEAINNDTNISQLIRDMIKEKMSNAS